MVKSKLALATATALGLLMGGALANGNFSNVEQDGSSNTASVNQSDGTSNKVGQDSPLAARQDGGNNVLTFTQPGDKNEIGTGVDGFLQENHRNAATITQSSDENKVLNVLQTGPSSTNGSLVRNTLTIDQKGGNGNEIWSISQTRGGSLSGQPGNLAIIGQDGGANTVEALTQNGLRNTAEIEQTGSNNEVRTVSQTGGQQTVDLVQEGTWHDIVTVTQTGVGQTAIVTQKGNENVVNTIQQTGADNVTRIFMDGSHNGIAALDWPSAEHPTLDIVFDNLPEASVYQDGADNDAILNIVNGGESNMFAFVQTGIGNNANGLIDGDDNAAAIRQSSVLLGNTGSYDIDGSDNHVFIGQTGGLTGGLNVASITIEGDNNHQAVIQNGRRNSSDIDVIGNGNVQQTTQTGNNNTVNIGVIGTNTNAGLFTENLPAWETAGSLVPGVVNQLGNRNTITFNVGGALGYETALANEGNLYAFQQSGNDNVITGSQNGNFNEVAIVQSGNNNYSFAQQTGSNNNIGISQ